jgi:hypothetical protein
LIAKLNVTSDALSVLTEGISSKVRLHAPITIAIGRWTHQICTQFYQLVSPLSGISDP